MPPADLDVYVHIGAPKSGTTFVQRMLWTHRRRLADDGVLYPYHRRTEHFEAMLDLRGVGWGDIAPEAVQGTWQRVADRVRAWDGHAAVVTNELLGAANQQQISRLLESLAPANVHVLYSARDLARQMVSSWQEQIKHNLSVTLEDFVAEMVDHRATTRPPYARLFWPLQDAAFVLSRWSEVIGADRVMVLTVPQPGGDADPLWQRFCSATGLRAERYDVTTPANVSLSVTEAEFFRRLNADLAHLRPRDYTRMVRNGLMRKVARGHGCGLALPPQHLPALHRRAGELVSALRESDYRVVGDLDDLLPEPERHHAYVPGSEVGDDELLALALRSIDVLLDAEAERASDVVTKTPARPRARRGSFWRRRRA